MDTQHSNSAAETASILDAFCGTGYPGIRSVGRTARTASRINANLILLLTEYLLNAHLS
jgi:16S rRNA G966 N2-methylase RsmD